MGKRLVIAEKPSVARDIAAALGGFTDHDDWLESDDYIVTFAVGHLLELAEPQDYDKKYKSWAIKNLPVIPDDFLINPREGQKKRLDAIKKLGHRKGVEGVINACDAGREGELIYRRIVEYCELGKLPQQRLWLQSMTKDSIRKAFNSLRPGKEMDRLADAAWLRAVGDWLVGMNATRALTQRLKNRADPEPWSAGRVQTPTLNLLVMRERQVLAHVPRPYWELFGKFRHAALEWEGRYWEPQPKVASDEEDEDADPEAKPSRLFDRARVDRLMAALSTAKLGDATEKRKKSRQNPPLPFDLTTLQRESNRRFSFSAKRTLDAAQRLYEGAKLITYPRTDSRHLPGDYADTVGQILTGLGRASDWKGLSAEIAAAPLNLEKLLDDTKVRDHFAIVPTGNVPEGPMRADDERVFELIVRQFLSALMGPATWSQVERIVTVAAGEESARFRTTSRTLEEPGFFRALGIPTEANPLPALVPGKDEASGVRTDVVEVREEAKETKPPPRYSEAQLLRMMETAGERIVDNDDLVDAMRGRGLGTPATRAETIEGLVRKGYARRVDNRLGPTSKAMRLMDVLTRVNVGALADPKMTGEWEHALAQVEQGELKRKTLLDRMVGFTRDFTGSLSTFEHAALYANEPSLGTCPACEQGEVIESTWGYRCTRNDGADAPCMFMIWKDRAGRYVDRDLVKGLLATRKVGPIGGFVDRSGRSLIGTVNLEPDVDKPGKWKLRLDWGNGGGGDTGPEVAAGTLCACPAHPDCTVVETNRRFVCKQVMDGVEKKGPLLPKVVCQREVTAEEALKFFTEGRTDLIEGFTSRFGRPFRAWLSRLETGRYTFLFPQRGGDPANPVPQTEEEAKAYGKARAAAKGKKGAGKGAKDDAEVTAKGAKGAKKSSKAAKSAAKATKSAGKGAKSAAKTVKSAGKGAVEKAAKATKSAGKGAKSSGRAGPKSAGKAAKASKAGSKSAGKAAKSPRKAKREASAPHA